MDYFKLGEEAGVAAGIAGMARLAGLASTAGKRMRTAQAATRDTRDAHPGSRRAKRRNGRIKRGNRSVFRLRGDGRRVLHSKPRWKRDLEHTARSGSVKVGLDVFGEARRIRSPACASFARVARRQKMIELPRVSWRDGRQALRARALVAFGDGVVMRR